MSADITIPRGSYGYNLRLPVTDADDNHYPLTGYTLTMKVWYKGASANPILSGDCTIDPISNWICHYPVVTGNFDKEADYLIALHLTKTGALEKTKYYTLRVEESA